jgi:hypothetical protein
MQSRYWVPVVEKGAHLEMHHVVIVDLFADFTMHLQERHARMIPRVAFINMAENKL